MSYQPNIPTGLLDLSVDYLNIQNNFTALNNVFGVDHTTFDNATSNKGYHTVIHAISQSGDPTAVSGSGELYVKTVNTGGNNDTALFFRTGTNGFVSQITNNFVPSNAANGYTYLPGGLMLQWGTKTNPGTSGTITFLTSGNLNFSTIIQVQCQLYHNSLANESVTVDGSSPPTNTQFKYFTTSSSSNTILKWWALGY